MFSGGIERDSSMKWVKGDQQVIKELHTQKV